MFTVFSVEYHQLHFKKKKKEDKQVTGKEQPASMPFVMLVGCLPSLFLVLKMEAVHPS
jgi:hypothetical protein